MASRLQETIGHIPPCTVFFIGLCLAVFVFQFLFGGVNKSAISAYAVLHQYQFYRIFTSTFTHLNILHIVFNLMSFYNMNPSLERKYGSVLMLYLILLFTVLNGLLYVFMFQLLSFISTSFLYRSAAGFSGVIFSLLTTSSLVLTTEDRLSIFGFFSVPRKWYALTYLILMTVLLPGASFVGHLCGVITGFLFSSGYLNWCIPMHFIVRMESGVIGKWMKKSNAFIYIPEIHELSGTTLSIGDMVSIGIDSIKSLLVWSCCATRSIVMFCVDSVFPPVIVNEEPLPASGQNSDIENRPNGELSAEEIRRQRLEALSSM